MAEISTLLYQPVFQTAYVTDDLDKAIDLFARTQGITQFYRISGAILPSLSGGQMTLDMGLAWVGPTMVEIIALKGGDDQLYRQALPRGEFAVRLHHIGIRLHSDAQWTEMLRQVEERGHEIVLRAATASTRALYIDTRAQLGHHIEYLQYLDEANSSLPRIPQNFPGAGVSA